MLAQTPPFYIYSGAAYDHAPLLECWPAWPYEDQAAEVRMLQLLWTHPARVDIAERASVFIVPAMPYLSYLAGDCFGSSHEARMGRVAASLLRSPYLARSAGWDHMMVSNTFRTAAFRALKGVLANATIGWFEEPSALRAGPNTLYKQAFWRCTVVVPYQANPFCAQQRAAHRPGIARDISIFFQGSWNAAKRLRSYFSSLTSLERANILDVSREEMNAMLPWSRLNSSYRSANELIEKKRAMARFSKLGTAQGMLRSEFCLVPKAGTRMCHGMLN
uniref:Exostosin GT47 domain-containing protein n=1 Tax=Calcidiscus leptoporus TaxID=127549 RepID=A0A7S0P623_9EUKA|mmetsp:Transcript_8877/g.20727  ORF Transcript_8877/g.20727 Transcript_8877/m.20727 type:complete len:276 (+) Transcript_8877:85-912(+)